MIADTQQGFITLTDIVKSYMSRAQKTQHDLPRLMAIASDGVAVMNFGVTQSIKSHDFELNPNTKSIDFPPGYVKYTKIGVCVNGNLITLGLNPNICTELQYNECGDLETFIGGNLSGGPNNLTGGQTPDYGGNWFMNYGAGGFKAYGHGAGFKFGYYKEDREHRRILFNSDFPYQTVTMEFLTSGYVPGTETFIEAFAAEALLAWLAWKDIQFLPAMASIAEIRKREYAIEANKARLMHRGFSLDEFIQAARTAYKQVAKY